LQNKLAFMSLIGKNIKKIRTTKGLNQTDFGKIFNLTRGSIGSYEEGRAEPKIETLKHIAKKFSISLDLLITTELTVNQLSGFSPENLMNFREHENQNLGLPSVLPKILKDKHGDFDLIKENTFFKTSLSGRAEFSLPLDDTVQLAGISAKRGDILFCKKTLAKTTFGYIVLRESQIFWQGHEPQKEDGVIFTVIGLISSSFSLENKNPMQEKMSELELRIINLESKR
jgi:transcriptional regulator with XRE-family HTH domain